MAAFVFNIPYDEVSKDQRKHGKNIVLGCGYGMGAFKFQHMCELNGSPITEDMAKECVFSYRKRYRHVSSYWRRVEEYIVNVLLDGSAPDAGLKITAVKQQGALFIQLPSGRKLAYPGARWSEGGLQYKSTLKKDGQFQLEKTYGGKLVENITQAVARDILAHGMLLAERQGYRVISTIHDEIVTEVPEDFGGVATFESLICILPAWAKGLPLKAEGYRAKRYKK
jgi:DNA polymerase